MKKSIFIIAAALLMVSSAFANGNGTRKASQVAFISSGDQQYRLIYPFKEEGKVYIKFLDKKGNTIDRDYVKNTEGFLRRYDLKGLKPGSYTLEIKSEGQVMTKPFFVENQQKYAVQHLGNKKVRLLIDESVEEGKIHIYNNNGELLHKESHQAIHGLVRTYDLSKFDCCKFYFVVNGESSLAINTNGN